jgi:tripartite-type tricarboxylate transporter receptor subunit TctC
MRASRRQWLRLSVGAAALTVLVEDASALDYPERPARIIVGFPAGTSSDITARLIAQWLSQQLGQQFVVEDRPGAGTNIAADTVVHATPDGTRFFGSRKQTRSMRRSTIISTSISSGILNRSPAFFAFRR